MATTLQQAEAAEHQLRNLQEAAALAPQLRAEQAQAQRQAQHAQRQTQARVVARQAVAQMRENAEGYRQRFAVLLAEAGALAADVALDKQALGVARRALLGAFGESRLNPEWHAAGGNDPALAWRPDRDDGRVFRVPEFDESLGRLLDKWAGVEANQR